MVAKFKKSPIPFPAQPGFTHHQPRKYHPIDASMAVATM